MENFEHFVPLPCRLLLDITAHSAALAACQKGASSAFNSARARHACAGAAWREGLEILAHLQEASRQVDFVGTSAQGIPEASVSSDAPSLLVAPWPSTAAERSQQKQETLMRLVRPHWALAYTVPGAQAWALCQGRRIWRKSLSAAAAQQKIATESSMTANKPPALSPSTRESKRFRSAQPEMANAPPRAAAVSQPQNSRILAWILPTPGNKTSLGEGHSPTLRKKRSASCDMCPHSVSIALPTDD